jgi:hypothetical protein
MKRSLKRLQTSHTSANVFLEFYCIRG